VKRERLAIVNTRKTPADELHPKSWTSIQALGCFSWRSMIDRQPTHCLTELATNYLRRSWVLVILQFLDPRGELFCEEFRYHPQSFGDKSASRPNQGDVSRFSNESLEDEHDVRMPQLAYQ